jgi:hypothetical protein|tara:strand:+ start:44 stop:250 length:207 start_codon:yes stop_codon:yes gene_type:complete
VTDKNIIEIQGRLFHVKRKFPENRINLNVENGVITLKQYYHCDTIFKSQGLIWFCNEIKDIEYEEITE